MNKNSKKNKTLWVDKDERFVWKVCPRCGELTVETKDPTYEPTPEDEKYIKGLTKALVFPKKFDRFGKKCNLEKWSKHILVK